MNSSFARFPAKAFAAIMMTIAIAAGAFAAPTAARADSTCPDFNVCFWTAQQYMGGKQVYGAGSAGAWRYVDGTGQNYNSLKNKFSNRAVWTAIAGGAGTCTLPGGIRATPPAFNVFYILPGPTC